MQCEHCGGCTKVIDTRYNSGDHGGSPVNTQSIRRRRECLRCGKRFSTYETRFEESSAVALTELERQVEDLRNYLLGSFDGETYLAIARVNPERAIRALIAIVGFQLSEVSTAVGFSDTYVSKVLSDHIPVDARDKIIRYIDNHLRFSRGERPHNHSHSGT